MEMTTYVDRLAAAVASKQESAFEELCFDLEYEQVGKDNWPAEVFDFFIDALNTPEICALKGGHSFITSLRRDFEKLTHQQQERLLLVIGGNVDQFGDEMLRHAASDLVARMYTASVALQTFSEWMRLATPRRLHMAQVGFEVLLMAKRLEPGQEKRVRAHLEEMRHRVEPH